MLVIVYIHRRPIGLVLCPRFRPDSPSAHSLSLSAPAIQPRKRAVEPDIVLHCPSDKELDSQPPETVSSGTVLIVVSSSSELLDSRPSSTDLHTGFLTKHTLGPSLAGVGYPTDLVSSQSRKRKSQGLYLVGRRNSCARWRIPGLDFTGFLGQRNTDI